MVFARRADDFGAERLQEAVQFVDIGALAGAEAEVMQADALLFEGDALVLWRWRADAQRGAAADAVIGRLAIDDRPQPKKRQQLAIKIAGAFVIRSGEENMCDAVDFHCLPLRGNLR
ncbi:hypothetical protein LMTR13_01850 [Bradyrhizobium icense]|uniref:Uncharacterized protein n=1 Tax=Bradyrhizobium icense TaxID=1274631 RepID=A0A1B1U8M4_9BRAD|nr:hypothetical protein LMTR13_01850 [Bradyrhizobium icense]